MRCAESKGNMRSTLRTNLHEPRTNTNHSQQYRDSQTVGLSKGLSTKTNHTSNQNNRHIYKDTKRYTHTSSPPATRKGLSASEVLSEEQEAVRTRAEHRRNGSHDE